MAEAGHQEKRRLDSRGDGNQQKEASVVGPPSLAERPAPLAEILLVFDNVPYRFRQTPDD